MTSAGLSLSRAERTCAAGAVLAYAADTPIPLPDPLLLVVKNNNPLASAVTAADDAETTKASVAAGTNRWDQASAARVVERAAEA